MNCEHFHVFQYDTMQSQYDTMQSPVSLLGTENFFVPISLIIRKNLHSGFLHKVTSLSSNGQIQAIVN